MESTKYFILLALAEGPLHGTAIRDQMVGDTLGIYLRDSTLYSALKSMLKAGLIEQLESEQAYGKSYRLTGIGRKRLENEARRHVRAVHLAGERLGIRLR